MQSTSQPVVHSLGSCFIQFSREHLYSSVSHGVHGRDFFKLSLTLFIRYDVTYVLCMLSVQWSVSGKVVRVNGCSVIGCVSE